MYIEFVCIITFFCIIGFVCSAAAMKEYAEGFLGAIIFGLILSGLIFIIFRFNSQPPIIEKREYFSAIIKDDKAYIVDFDSEKVIDLNFVFRKNIKEGTKIEKQIHSCGPYYGLYTSSPTHKYVIAEEQ